jgi:hypothetical protein
MNPDYTRGGGDSMASIYDGLCGKIDRASSRTARDGARRDLGLLPFARRGELRDLWKAAEGRVQGADAEASGALAAAVEKLRPLFGEGTS